MRYVDSNVDRKNKLQNDHLHGAKRLENGEPIFAHIEFSICGLCNRTCHFCPRSDAQRFPNRKEYLSLNLYAKILGDLAAVDYDGRLSYSGFSEPFYHKRLDRLVTMTKEILPRSTVELVTNGDMLNVAKLKSVFAAGLDKMLISMYDGPEQIQSLEAIRDQAGIPPDKFLLRKRFLAAEENYGINLSNRAGTVINLEGIGIKALREPMGHACYYTHYRMMVDHTGEVLLCPHDWSKKLIVGDLNRENILEVWTGKILSRIRQRLGAADRHFSPCNVCDVEGTLQGEQHFLAWQALAAQSAR
jgi:MoaA/NifB/PqqE/SkfB family radical SAM enzyme